MPPRLFFAGAIALAGFGPAAAQALTGHQQRALEIYKELVEIDTVPASTGMTPSRACGADRGGRPNTRDS